VLRYVGMIYEPTVEHLVSLALRKQPERSTRRVRNLSRAMNDPVLGAARVVTHSPESIVLVDDKDVEEWLETTKAAPLRLLAILERVLATGETADRQTPLLLAGITSTIRHLVPWRSLLNPPTTSNRRQSAAAAPPRAKGTRS